MTTEEQQLPGSLVDKAEAWDAIAEKNAIIAALRADVAAARSVYLTLQQSSAVVVKRLVASEAKVAELQEALKRHEQLLLINAVRAVAAEHAPLWLEAADAAAERVRAGEHPK